MGLAWSILRCRFVVGEVLQRSKIVLRERRRAALGYAYMRWRV